MPKLLKFKGSNSTLKPDAGHRKLIEQGAQADINRCWTCGSCDFECPVNVATGQLRPQKIVRMANLGLLDELLYEPAIWYCLTCRRCLQICPNTVKPSELIFHIRRVSMFC
jgi:heterodisulfide reductase subunit C2